MPLEQRQLNIVGTLQCLPETQKQKEREANGGRSRQWMMIVVLAGWPNSTTTRLPLYALSPNLASIRRQQQIDQIGRTRKCAAHASHNLLSCHIGASLALALAAAVTAVATNKTLLAGIGVSNIRFVVFIMSDDAGWLWCWSPAVVAKSLLLRASASSSRPAAAAAPAVGLTTIHQPTYRLKLELDQCELLLFVFWASRRRRRGHVLFNYSNCTPALLELVCRSCCVCVCCSRQQQSSASLDPISCD